MGEETSGRVGERRVVVGGGGREWLATIVKET